MARAEERHPRLGASRRRLPGLGGHPAPVKDESEVRWLISYSDFMMQLVCYFILLYSISAMEKGKANPVAQAWRQQVGIEPITATAQTLRGSSVPLTLAEIPGMVREIEVVLKRFPEGSHLRVTPTSDGFKLQILFEMFLEGSGVPTQEGTRLLDLGALVLKPFQARFHTLEIVGHTAASDADREEGSALRLSLTRAREAYRYLTGRDCPDPLIKEGLEAAGRGAHDPLANNAEPSRRGLNRRVEFVARVGS